ncbi:MAG: hypothetical protein IH588_15945 [Anaerolineales bacterium]|nr:hypothetical protein [Anaerolineales bacterium]
MPNIYFILFEIIIYVQFALCLLKLGFGILFGLMLELATIRQLNAYEYGRFICTVNR